MKPMIIIPPKQMSQADLKLLRENDICVVVAKDPNRVRFMDPIPAASSRTEMENAAIKLSRTLLNWPWQGNSLDKTDVAKLFVQFLVQGTPLDAKGTEEEQLNEVKRNARWDEECKMVREEARAARAAKKAAASQATT